MNSDFLKVALLVVWLPALGVVAQTCQNCVESGCTYCEPSSKILQDPQCVCDFANFTGDAIPGTMRLGSCNDILDTGSISTTSATTITSTALCDFFDDPSVTCTQCVAKGDDCVYCEASYSGYPSGCICGDNGVEDKCADLGYFATTYSTGEQCATLDDFTKVLNTSTAIATGTLIAIIVVPIVVIIACIVGCVFCCMKRKEQHRDEPAPTRTKAATTHISTSGVAEPTTHDSSTKFGGNCETEYDDS